MGKVVELSSHESYVPTKVKALDFYKYDSNLDVVARELYQHLEGISKRKHSTTYLDWPTTEEAMNALFQSNWGKDLPGYVIKSAFALLRKNRYLRFTYDSTIQARILELMEFIGESSK